MPPPGWPSLDSTTKTVSAGDLSNLGESESVIKHFKFIPYKMQLLALDTL